MSDLATFDLAVFLLATFIGALIAGVAGFAFGLIASAIWLHVITPAQSAALIAGIYSLARPTLPAVGGGRLADGMTGAASGFFGGSTGLAGLPVIVWSTLRRWPKDEQRAVFQPVAVAIFALTLLWFGGTVRLTSETIKLFIAGLPAALLGTWLGFRLYGRINETTFRFVVLVLLLISGPTLLPWPGLRGI